MDSDDDDDDDGNDKANIEKRIAKIADSIIVKTNALFNYVHSIPAVLDSRSVILACGSPYNEAFMGSFSSYLRQHITFSMHKPRKLKKWRANAIWDATSAAMRHNRRYLLLSVLHCMQ